MKTRVARYHADRTNQKLYFARLYCQLAEQSENYQLKEAHIESALLHLYGGYLAFLQEIARYYHLSLVAPTLNDIEQILAKKTQVSPEVLRLKKLLAHDFLGEIEQAWQQVLYKPAPLTPNTTDTTDTPATTKQGQLVVIDVMSSPLNHTISVDMIRQWRSNLLAIIDTLREGMIEF